MKRKTLSLLITHTLLALLPALSAYALLAWYCGAPLRVADAFVLLAFSLLLALSGLLHPICGPVGFGALAAVLAVSFTDRAALYAFFRALLSGGIADGSRSGLLLGAGAVGLLGLFLLRHYPLRAAVSVLAAAFWIYAAFRLPLIPKLAFAAAAPILLFTLCETIFRVFGVEAEALEASATRLLLFCALSLVLLFALPSSNEPYPYPLYNALRSRIVDLFERVETQLLYRRSGSGEFTVRFNGYTDEAVPGGTVEQDDMHLIYIQPGPDTGGVFYLAGSSWDAFDGGQWSSTVDRELVDTLGWSADAAERLYAYWRIRQQADSPLYVGENSLYLHYRNMDVRTLFTVQNTYFIRADADRYPFRSQPSKVLFDYLQDREAMYRLFLLHPYAAEETLLASAEGYEYDEHSTLQWNTVLQDFGDVFGVGMDRAAKVEPFLARRASFIYRHFLTLPDKVSAELRDLAQRVTSGCETDGEKLAAITAYLQTQYSYTRSPSPVPAGEDLLDYLLFESKEGYCTWYATAAAVLGRLAGVPTRYVQGFRIELEKGRPGVISAANSHAWCEGYIKGYGWVTVDATPGFSTSLPTETFEPEGAVELEPADVPDDVKAPIPGGIEVAAPEAEDEAPRSTLGRQHLTAIAAAAGLFLLAAAAVLLLRAHGKRRDYAAADFRERTVRDLRTLLGYLSKRGYPRGENESLRQFFSGVRWHYLTDEPAQADEMLRLYEDVLFGGKLPTEEEWLKQRQFVNQFRPRYKK